MSACSDNPALFPLSQPTYASHWPAWWQSHQLCLCFWRIAVLPAPVLVLRIPDTLLSVPRCRLALHPNAKVAHDSLQDCGIAARLRGHAHTPLLREGADRLMPIYFRAGPQTQLQVYYRLKYN